MLSNEQRNHCAQSQTPVQFFRPPPHSALEVHRAGGRYRETGALHAACTAHHSGPSQQCVQCVRALRCKPLGLGVPVPPTPHRKAPEAFLPPLCTGQGGRAGHDPPLRKPSYGPALGVRWAGQCCRAVCVRARSVPRGVTIVLFLSGRRPLGAGKGLTCFSRKCRVTTVS